MNPKEVMAGIAVAVILQAWVLVMPFAAFIVPLLFGLALGAFLNAKRFNDYCMAGFAGGLLVLAVAKVVLSVMA